MLLVCYVSLLTVFLVPFLGCSASYEQDPNNHFHNVKFSQATKEIDAKTALNLVWKLPQVQRKAKEIERLSKGSIRVAAAIDSYPTSEQPYYTIKVFENHLKYVHTIYWFRVLTPSGTIQVLDILQNEYVSLDRWKPN